MSSAARVMVTVEPTERSRGALELAERLHQRFGLAIDVFYVWATPPDAEGAPAWTTLDYLQGLEQRRVVAVRGYLTPEKTGRTLLAHALREGYGLLLVGARESSEAGQRYKMHWQRARAIP